MSILHVAMFRWVDGVTKEQIDAFTRALGELRIKMPMLKSYEYGPDLGLRDGNFDYGVVAELESADLIDGYLDHEIHQQFVRDFVQSLVVERRAVQIEVRPDASRVR